MCHGLLLLLSSPVCENMNVVLDFVLCLVNPGECQCCVSEQFDSWMSLLEEKLGGRFFLQLVSKCYACVHKTIIG
jgi:hypothetical protein